MHTCKVCPYLRLFHFTKVSWVVLPLMISDSISGGATGDGGLTGTGDTIFGGRPRLLFDPTMTSMSNCNSSLI